MAGLDSNRGAKRAREARQALGLNAGAPVDCLLTVVEERAAVPVVVAALPGDLAGACYRESDQDVVVWVNGSQHVVRQRFTLAHELGHAWCRHDGRLEPDSFATVSGRTSNPLEIQANAFAAEFLVPRAGLEARGVGEPTLEDVVTVAAEHGVSAIMVVYRFKQLKLASDRRVAALEAEIEERLHERLFGELGLDPLVDRLAAVESLPYLSPGLAGTLLDAALHGVPAVEADVVGAVGRLLL